jgi:hypothetical protein
MKHDIAIGRRLCPMRRERRFVCGKLANQKSSLPDDFVMNTYLKFRLPMYAANVTVFVQKYFPYEKKRIADDMVEKIRDGDASISLI